jgi:hypothetical protein
MVRAAAREAAREVGAAARGGGLNSCEQIPVAVELVLPVAIDRGQPARRAAAADVEPADVFAARVEGHADGDLELLTATRAGALLQTRVLQVLVAIPDGVLGVATDAGANGRDRSPRSKRRSDGRWSIQTSGRVNRPRSLRSTLQRGRDYPRRSDRSDGRWPFTGSARCPTCSHYRNGSLVFRHRPDMRYRAGCASGGS